MGHSAEEILALVGSFVCEQQTKLSQYLFMSSLYHKALKEKISEIGDSDLRESKLKNKEDFKEELFSRLITLETFLHEEFHNAFLSGFDHAMKFFKDRSNLKPRMCLKVISKDDLFVLFRAPELAVKNLNVKLTQNTAFDVISKGNSFYLENDIPGQVEKGAYKNLRIDERLVRQYNRNKAVSQPFSRETNYDDEWIKCWKKIDSLDNNSKKILPPPQTCYKSTLVVPMSLPTKDLQPKYKEHFRLADETERTIFGFLCFDNHNTNYFRQEEDVRFAYIIADMMSLYLIQQLVYTQFSSAYATAITLLKYMREV